MTARNLNNLPSVEQLRAAFVYEPNTGVFRHLPRFDCPAWWNTKYAGKIAGTISKTTTGYVNIKYMRRGIRAHQAAWAIIHGKWPDDQIDHINGDRADNRLINLRPATQPDNARNKISGISTQSGFRGVFPHLKKWKARISFNKRQIHLGCFNTPEQAYAVYCEAAQRLHGEFACSR